jgi:hypothetical protein
VTETWQVGDAMDERERARAGERLAELAGVIAASKGARRGPTDTAVYLLDLSGVAVIHADSSDRMEVLVCSDERSHRFQQLELKEGDGPAMTAYRTGRPVQMAVSDLDDRWPVLAAAARAEQFGVVSASPLDSPTDRIGAISLFRPDSAGQLDEAEFRLAKALGELAVAGALQQRALNEASTVMDQLTSALKSRVIVEQAKSIVAERHGVGAAAAFGMLRAYSRSTRLPLTSIAAAIVSGELDAGPIGGSEPSAKPRATNRPK